MALLLPTELTVSLAGARLTPGRITLALLFLPALVTMFRKTRRFGASDLLAFTTATWMVGAAVYTAGSAALSSATAEAFEFFSAYIVARAYFFGRPALETFIKALKTFTIIAIVLAVADTLSRRFLVHEIVAAWVHAIPPFPQYRENMIRATSTFDHPILFGTFCTFAAAIFLYSERTGLRRILFAGLCSFGCLLSLSSAPLLSLAIVLGAYVYDQLLHQYSWRWKALWAAIITFVVAVFLISNHPVGWLVSHLTLDPQTGYYRIMIWDVATRQISLSPFTGFAFALFNDQVLDNTVDCVWLVYSLRFGIPMMALLLLTNLTAIGKNRPIGPDPYLNKLTTAFSLVLALFIVIGLTVHFWNYMWIFWSLCIGIRASLREEFRSPAIQAVVQAPAIRRLNRGFQRLSRSPSPPTSPGRLASR